MKKMFNKPLTYVNGWGWGKALYVKQRERRLL